MKRQVRLLVDIVMYALFLYLMSYQAGRGLLPHGVLGCVLLGLFLLHHLLNAGWHRGLRRGRYSAPRVAFLVLNLLLLMAMVLMAVSSVMMSGHVFAFSPVPATEAGRALHTVSTAWGFVLTAFHIGLHTHVPLQNLYRAIRDTSFGYAYVLLFLLVLAAGTGCFAWSGLWRGMLMLPNGGVAVQPVVFYGQALGMTAAVCQLVHLLMLVCSHSSNKKGDASA